MLLGGEVISTVKELSSNVQKKVLPLMVIIDDGSPSYTDGGNAKMDKINENILSHYTRNNHSLYIESVFSEKTTLQELIKEYLLEQRNSKIEVADTTFSRYNTSGNMVAVTSTEEGSE